MQYCNIIRPDKPGKAKAQRNSKFVLTRFVV